MTLKYFGTTSEKGLTLTSDLFTSEGDLIYSGFLMLETIPSESAIYRTEDIFLTINNLTPGIYITRTVSEDGTFLGYGEVIFDGNREITLLELRMMTDTELMQLRDALGIDGDKMVARGGQLQLKAEK